MSRSKHDEHFTGLWVAQQARGTRWGGNVTVQGIGVVQPEERAATTGRASGVAVKAAVTAATQFPIAHAGRDGAVCPGPKCEGDTRGMRTSGASSAHNDVTARRDEQTTTVAQARLGNVGRDEFSLSGAMDASHAGSIPAATPSQQRAKADSGGRGSRSLRNAEASSPPIPTLTAAVSKYGNKRTGGYASKREAKRAAELRLLEKAGAIRNLREQVPYLLIPAQEGERACWYVADFVYDEGPLYAVGPLADWHTVVEDCKGFRTDVYRIKRKLMLLVHKIKVRET